MLDKGDADLSILFTTDAQLFTDPDKYTILEDDKERASRPGTCSSSPGSRPSTRPGPTSAPRSSSVQGNLTLEVMQELNARVDLDKEKPADVAHDYLVEFGLRRVARACQL